ncbi:MULTISPECIES: S46 family peptidase, partial [Comamonas]|uniref:S46 family peptidase n=1 Tax=Comamonas TaxID=283 RepID=UPI00237D8BD9
MYFAGRREMDPKRLMPSDANFTMRMSYGSIKRYEPADAVTYRYYTTDKGLLEKYDPNSDEFNLQKDILDLVKRKDFGKYGVNGNLNIAFLSTNDITGGNSGSPVFNKN